MISIDMTKEQFECIKSKSADPLGEVTREAFVINNVSEDGLKGHLRTCEVDSDFEYREEGHALILENEIKHGLFGMETEDTIGQHIVSILGDIKCSDTQVPAQNFASTSKPVSET